MIETTRKMSAASRPWLTPRIIDHQLRFRGAVDPLTGPGFSRTISHRLNPELRRRGFVAGPGGLSWSRKVDNDTIRLRFRRHPNAVDPYQGGRFQVELERTANKLGAAFSGRARLDQLLTKEELKRLVEVQNGIIRSLPAPPAEHINTYPASCGARTWMDFARKACTAQVTCGFGFIPTTTWSGGPT
jgi:hypothetical protein